MADIQKIARKDMAVGSVTLRGREDSVTSEVSMSSERDPMAALEYAMTQTDLSPDDPLHRSRSNGKAHSFTSTVELRDPEFEIDFKDNDPDDPKNWPLWKRGITISFLSFASWTVLMYSTSYNNGIPSMLKDFHTKNQTEATTGVTSYLLGMAVGALMLAPLSEIFGRRPVYIGSILFFAIMIIPCALARNLETLIMFRFVGALAGSVMLSNAPGSLNDISGDRYRLRAFSLWSLGPLNTPVAGPVLGGFVYQYLGWRWNNWIMLIFAGVAWIMVLFIPETYAPVIIKKKAAEMRKKTGDDRYWCQQEEGKSFGEILRINFSRPFKLAATEPILWFWDLYLGLIYGILYLCFVAYPYIFTTVRGWSPGFAGLAFAGMGIGGCIAIFMEPWFSRIIMSHPKNPVTGEIPPEASVKIICWGAIMVPIGQLIFAWTSLPTTIHWAYSIAAGIPFGAGNTIIFIYANNYIAGSYKRYAASALAGNSVARCVVGGTLPLAGMKMLTTLTPQWAGTLLGLLTALCIPIPFVFYKWGHLIRQKSPMIIKMKQEEEKTERKRARARSGASLATVMEVSTEKLAKREGPSQGDEPGQGDGPDQGDGPGQGDGANQLWLQEYQLQLMLLEQQMKARREARQWQDRNMGNNILTGRSTGDQRKATAGETLSSESG